jgi:DNA invertase Pin-like site-specific DNA recombinase
MMYHSRNAGEEVTMRAVGVVRVSRVKGRDKKNGGDSFRSPELQRERIEEVCDAHAWKLGSVFEEMDVSGGNVLDKRPGLLAAVEAIEAGRAGVLVVAYCDRLTRGHVRDEVLDRVEAAGGEVWTADMGRQSNGTAAERFTGGVLERAAQYVKDAAAEKARAAQIDRVEAGVWMSPGVPAGYVLAVDRKLTPDPKLAPIVREAFELRANGARLEEVRAFLAERGIERTRAGVAQLLRNRAYLGELHFGELHNPEAHPAIVDRVTFERARRVTITRGRHAKSDHLLARLGVLRCAACDARMSVNTSNYRYRCYRCANEDCERRAYVSAPLIEEHVVEHVKHAIVGITETAHAEHDLDAAERQVEEAEHRYAAAVEVLDPTEAAEVERLRQFKAERDAARQDLEERKQSLGAATLAVGVEDWDDLTRDEQRGLIRAVLERVTVAPGQGRDRIKIERKS